MRIFRSALAAGLLAAAPISIGAFAVSAVPAAAQNALDQFEVMFQNREAQRRATISNSMSFTEAEAAQYWPIYDLYRFKAKQHQLRRFQLVRQLSQNTVGMDAETANALIQTAITLEADKGAAKAEFLEEIAPHFSGARHFRLYQLETKLIAIFEFGWTRQIPLAVTEEELHMLQEGVEMEHAEQHARQAVPTT